jgi:hypothetical protein
MCSSACVAFWLHPETLVWKQSGLSAFTLPYLTVALSLALSISAIILHPSTLGELQRIFPKSVFSHAPNGIPMFMHEPSSYKFFPDIPIDPVKQQTIVAAFPNMRQAEEMNPLHKYVLPLNDFFYIDNPVIRAVICGRIVPLLRNPEVIVVSAGSRSSLQSKCAAGESRASS